MKQRKISKRQNNTGTVTFRKNRNKWIARSIITTDAKGKVIYKCIGSFDSKEEAEAALEIYNKNNESIKAEAKLKTFEKVYFEAMEAQTGSRSKKKGLHCKEQYKSYFKIFKKFHHQIFNQIEFDDLKQTLIDAKKNAPTNKKAKIMINIMYSYAFAKEYINKDLTASKYAWSGVDFTSKNKEKIHRAFTAEEIKTMFADVDNQFFVDIMKFLLYTGLRTNEFINLKKDSVFINDKFQYILLNDEVAKNSTTRVIPIHHDILEIVKNRLSSGKSEYLFETISGKKFSSQVFRRNYFDPFMQNNGIENALPHDTRYSFNFYAELCDMKSSYIEYILGHSSEVNMRYLYNDSFNANAPKNQHAIQSLCKFIQKLNFEVDEKIFDEEIEYEISMKK